MVTVVLEPPVDPDYLDAVERWSALWTALDELWDATG
jgi:hypothetical protein